MRQRRVAHYQHILALTPSTRCPRQDYATGRLEANQRLRAGQLRDLLTALGPAFVKVGQALSSRPDLLPQTYLEVPRPGPSLRAAPPAPALLDAQEVHWMCAQVLGELQDRLAPFSSAVAYALIEQELGAPVGAVFSALSPEPVAAASLGQARGWFGLCVFPDLS